MSSGKSGARQAKRAHPRSVLPSISGCAPPSLGDLHTLSHHLVLTCGVPATPHTRSAVLMTGRCARSVRQQARLPCCRLLCPQTSAEVRPHGRPAVVRMQ